MFDRATITLCIGPHSSSFILRAASVRPYVGEKCRNNAGAAVVKLAADSGRPEVPLNDACARRDPGKMSGDVSDRRHPPTALINCTEMSTISSRSLAALLSATNFASCGQLVTALRNARIASAVLATAIPSVYVSVRLSVTRRYCVKTTPRNTVQFALSDSKMCVVL